MSVLMVSGIFTIAGFLAITGTTLWCLFRRAPALGSTTRTVLPVIGVYQGFLLLVLFGGFGGFIGRVIAAGYNPGHNDMLALLNAGVATACIFYAFKSSSVLRRYLEPKFRPTHDDNIA